MVSVIMPAYNAEKTISESVESVIFQTYKDWELIVIDDGSTDNTVAVLSQFAKSDSRIHFYQNKKNCGVSYTRNRAVELAKGEWIAFIDSDDLWDKEKLEKQISLLNEHPDMAIAYTASCFIDENGKPYEYMMPAIEKLTYKTLLIKNIMSCSSVLIRSSIMNDIRMPSDNMCEDYYTWLMVLREYGVAYGINEPLLIYRLSRNSRSSNRIKMIKMLFITYHKVGYNAIFSTLLVFRYILYSARKRYNIYHSNSKNIR